MSKALLLSFAVAGLAPVAAVAAGPAVHAPRPPGSTSAQWGASLYAANCLRCHGPNGDGTGSGPSLRGVGALAADFELRTGYMPLSSPYDQPQGKRVLFSPQEIDALVAYVASLGKGPAIPQPRPERGKLAEGLQLFTGHCAGCHQVAGAGGYLKGAIAPPLADATPVQIAEAVRLGPYLMPRFTPKQISNRQLDSIVAYVRYTHHPDDAGGWSLGHIGPVPEGLVTWLIAAAVLVAVCVAIGERVRR
jgi:ubiquinol-cytochrome c reductase cytochrome c subunit